MSNAVEDAHQAVVDQLNAALGGEATDSGLAGLEATRDAALPDDDVPRFLNVVINPQPATMTGEQLGLGADNVLVEFVQTFDVEFIVRVENAAQRRALFTAGLVLIGSTLLGDRTLAGKASGLSLGPPNYENHTFAGAPFTSACVIPVRVELRGLGSMLA